MVRLWFAMMGVDLDRVLDYINDPASYDPGQEEGHELHA